MTLGEIIKKHRAEHEMSMDSFASKSGMSKAYISLLEKNRHPKTGKPIAPSVQSIKLAADAMNIGFNELFAMIDSDVTVNEEISSELIQSSSGIKIPVLGRVAAGIPIEAVENIIDTEEISENMAKKGTFFGLKIHGNSMEPRIYEGDVVIVRQQEDAESGDVVIAIINGCDAICKRLRKYRDGIELVSNNPSYEPMFFDNETIASKPVKIIGKVVELRGKL